MEDEVKILIQAKLLRGFGNSQGIGKPSRRAGVCSRLGEKSSKGFERKSRPIKEGEIT
jgi:hypothetical protein